MPSPSAHPDSQHSPSTVEDPAFLLGYQMADETIRQIRDARMALPSVAALMEISAASRLDAWIEGGLCNSFDEEVGSAVASLDAATFHQLDDEHAFVAPNKLPPLTESVFDIWKRHFAWSALEEVGADVVIDQTGLHREALLEALADFLWTHRPR